MTPPEQVGYQYVVLRCVPRVDREEFINVGVVVYCQARDFLEARTYVDRPRLTAFDPTLDLDAVSAALAAICSICAGDPDSGSAASAPLGARFGFIAAPKSTVVQPGPVHGGVTSDPEAELAVLIDHFAGSA